MISRKVCLLGGFSVGKSSLVRRFVHEVFDDRYVTTLGVKIETRLIELEQETVKLIIWDMEGAKEEAGSADLVNSRMRAYLMGVNGVMLVADGTRLSTVDVAIELFHWLSQAHPGVPCSLLLNKFDLTNEWQVDDAVMQRIPAGLQSFTTSALSGDNVERTFSGLAEQMSKTE